MWVSPKVLLVAGHKTDHLRNARHEAVWMRYRDYEALEGPTRARFAEATTPRRPRLSHRRAG